MIDDTPDTNTTDSCMHEDSHGVRAHVVAGVGASVGPAQPVVLGKGKERAVPRPTPPSETESRLTASEYFDKHGPPNDDRFLPNHWMVFNLPLIHLNQSAPTFSGFAGTTKANVYRRLLLLLFYVNARLLTGKNGRFEPNELSRGRLRQVMSVTIETLYSDDGRPVAYRFWFLYRNPNLNVPYALDVVMDESSSRERTASKKARNAPVTDATDDFASHSDYEHIKSVQHLAADLPVYSGAGTNGEKTEVDILNEFVGMTDGAGPIQNRVSLANPLLFFGYTGLTRGLADCRVSEEYMNYKYYFNLPRDADFQTIEFAPAGGDWMEVPLSSVTPQGLYALRKPTPWLEKEKAADGPVSRARRELLEIERTERLQAIYRTANTVVDDPTDPMEVLQRISDLYGVQPALRDALERNLAIVENNPSGQAPGIFTTKFSAKMDTIERWLSAQRGVQSRCTPVEKAMAEFVRKDLGAALTVETKRYTVFDPYISYLANWTAHEQLLARNALKIVNAMRPFFVLDYAKLTSCLSEYGIQGTLHALLLGEAAASKSFLQSLVENRLVKDTVSKTTYSTARSGTGTDRGAHRDGIAEVRDEAAFTAQFGITSKGKQVAGGDDTMSSFFKSSVTERFAMITTYLATETADGLPQRSSLKRLVSLRNWYLQASNSTEVTAGDDHAGAILSRFLLMRIATNPTHQINLLNNGVGISKEGTRRCEKTEANRFAQQIHYFFWAYERLCEQGLVQGVNTDVGNIIIARVLGVLATHGIRSVCTRNAQRIHTAARIISTRDAIVRLVASDIGPYHNKEIDGEFFNMVGVNNVVNVEHVLQATFSLMPCFFDPHRYYYVFLIGTGAGHFVPREVVRRQQERTICSFCLTTDVFRTPLCAQSASLKSGDKCTVCDPERGYYCGANCSGCGQKQLSSDIVDETNNGPLFHIGVGAVILGRQSNPQGNGFGGGWDNVIPTARPSTYVVVEQSLEDCARAAAGACRLKRGTPAVGTILNELRQLTSPHSFYEYKSFAVLHEDEWHLYTTKDRGDGTPIGDDRGAFTRYMKQQQHGFDRHRQGDYQIRESSGKLRNYETYRSKRKVEIPGITSKYDRKAQKHVTMIHRDLLSATVEQLEEDLLRVFHVKGGEPRVSLYHSMLDETGSYMRKYKVNDPKIAQEFSIANPAHRTAAVEAVLSAQGKIVGGTEMTSAYVVVDDDIEEEAAARQLEAADLPENPHDAYYWGSPAHFHAQVMRAATATKKTRKHFVRYDSTTQVSTKDPRSDGRVRRPPRERRLPEVDALVQTVVDDVSAFS